MVVNYMLIIRYCSDANWCSRAKHLQAPVDSFQINWLKFSSIWKCLCKFQLIKLSAHLFKIIICTVVLCTRVLYMNVGPQAQALALMWVHQLASEWHCMYVQKFSLIWFTVVWEKFGVKKFSSDATYDEN